MRVCLSVCLFVRSCSGETLTFSTAPSERQGIFDKGLRFSSAQEAGGFIPVRKCQIKGRIRSKFPFSRVNLVKSQSPCVFYRGLRFSRPSGPSKFPSSNNKGSIKVRFHFILLTPKSVNRMCFCLKNAIFEFSQGYRVSF